MSINVDSSEIRKDGIIVRCGENGIELCVEDSATSPNKVLNVLREMRIPVEKLDLIIDAIKNAGTWVTVSKELVPPDLALEISSDEMEAYAIYLPGFCSYQMTKQDILKTLKDKGIFIQDENVAETLLKLPFEKVLIAKGEPPIDGRDASLEWSYQKPVNIVTDKEQHVDFKELVSKWDYVSAGTVLVEKIPAEKGKAGVTVKGRILPAKDGRDIDLRKLAGKNTSVSEDGLRIVAKTDGIAQKEGTRINVVSQLIISGDIDFHTGNVEGMVDAVQITGTVREGFKVIAKSSIQVHGVVEGSYLEAGQNIKIDGIVAGNNKATLKAGNSVMARQIIKAKVEAPIVVVESGILFSQVCCTDLYLTHSKGRISGSTINAERNIVSANVGNDLAERVVLQITGPKELVEEYEYISRTLMEKRKEYNELDDMTKKSPMMLKMYEEKLASLAAEIEILDDRVKTLLTERQEALKRAKIFIRDTVYPNVEIRFGSSVYLVKSELSFVTFLFEDGEVKFVPYINPPPIPRIANSR